MLLVSMLWLLQGELTVKLKRAKIITWQQFLPSDLGLAETPRKRCFGAWKDNIRVRILFQLKVNWDHFGLISTTVDKQYEIRMEKHDKAKERPDIQQ